MEDCPSTRHLIASQNDNSSIFRRPIPFLLITNGGGVLDHERLSFLSSELGIQLTPDQLVQSHTPMRDYAHKYKEKHVLVIGGKGESCRKVAESYVHRHKSWTCPS